MSVGKDEIENKEMKKNKMKTKVKQMLGITLCVIMGMMFCTGCSVKKQRQLTEQEQMAGQKLMAEQELMAGQEQMLEQGQTLKQEHTILIAAAASLKNVYENELLPAFKEKNEGITVEMTYGSSGELQVQIEEGLEADIFMPAATKQMNALIEGGYVEPSKSVELLINEIVLITPAEATLELNSFEDIIKADVIAIGDPESVPAGQYAKEALVNLKLWEEIQDSVSFGKDVTEVLNQVAAGSAECGIVYATDAASMSDKVKVVAAAPQGSLKTEVIYPVAVLKKSVAEAEADKFVAFLQTDEAKASFERYGFEIRQK